MKEEWKDVVGFEGFYTVSNLGEVKTVRRVVVRKNGHPHTVRSKLLRGWFMQGYRYVGLYRVLGEMTSRAVHRLVLEAFVGPCPDGAECCHGDGIRTNNRLDNLRWDTYKANMADRESHGRHDKGSDCVKAKLKESDIPVIREMLKDGILSMTRIGEIYSVHAATIRDIRDGFTWKHVT